ncbi:epithelial splicing regulatory protein 1 [Trichonephila clavipes]|nr:epithelial splicing regulatory protein 1 [Trichonephila clavipes]
MDCPAYSPDLNPIEHVWDRLDRRIAARQPPPICLPELRRALLDEWCNIPQDQIDNLIACLSVELFGHEQEWTNRRDRGARDEVKKKRDFLQDYEPVVVTYSRFDS